MWVKRRCAQCENLPTQKKLFYGHLNNVVLNLTEFWKYVKMRDIWLNFKHPVAEFSIYAQRHTIAMLRCRYRVETAVNCASPNRLVAGKEWQAGQSVGSAVTWQFMRTDHDDVITMSVSRQQRQTCPEYDMWHHARAAMTVAASFFIARRPSASMQSAIRRLQKKWCVCFPIYFAQFLDKFYETFSEYL